MNRKHFTILALFALLFSSLFASVNTVDAEAVQGSSVRNIETNAEYQNGTIPTPIGGIWYVWINVSTTQVIYYSLFSDVVNSPIINFLGQRFQVENDTEVFVGNTLALIEVYNDTSGDGIPQANFTSGETEIAYYLLVNSSVGYDVTPIQKFLEGGIAHYKWAFNYYTIDGFLLFPEDQPGQGAAYVTIDHLYFSYDFHVVENVSYVKTSFDIGRITEIQPAGGEPPVSLDGLSLSLLFSTVTISANPATAYVNGEPYNSTTAANTATATSSGEIAVKTIKAYEFLLGESYNLTRGETVETHPTKSEAAATTSIPQGAQSRISWMLAYFENNLNISDLFPSASGIGGNVNLNCSVSAFLYRICYPVWDGLMIQHDPTCVAYLFSNLIISEFPSLIILPLFMIALLLIVLAYRRKHPAQHPTTSSPKNEVHTKI